MTQSMKQTELFIKYSRAGICSVKPMRHFLLGNLYHHSHWHCPSTTFGDARSLFVKKQGNERLIYWDIQIGAVAASKSVTKLAKLRSVYMTFRT